MENRLNINLQTEDPTLLNPVRRQQMDTKSYKSPNKPLMAYKTAMKRSNSREKLDPNSVDESIEEMVSHNDNLPHSNKYTPKAAAGMSGVEKPFQRHNANRTAERERFEANLTPKGESAHKYKQFEQSKGFDTKEMENYNALYHSKAQEYTRAQPLTEKKENMNSYKSQRQLRKAPLRKSPSKEYILIKKKIEKEMKSPGQQLFKAQRKGYKDERKHPKYHSKISPNTSIRHLRSTSPNFKFAPTGKPNPMDLYRQKKVEEHKKHRKMSSEYKRSSIDSQRTKEFSNDEIKTNLPRPSVNNSRYKFKGHAKQGIISLTAKKEMETEK